MSTKIEPQFNSMAELKRKCMEVEQNSIRIIAEIEKLQQENKRYREALEKLARLGNGDKYGNSDGNIIAQDALNSLTHNKPVEKCSCDRTDGYSITGAMVNGKCVKVVCNICGKETPVSKPEISEAVLAGWIEEWDKESYQIFYAERFPKDLARFLKEKGV